MISNIINFRKLNAKKSKHMPSFNFIPFERVLACEKKAIF